MCIAGIGELGTSSLRVGQTRKQEDGQAQQLSTERALRLAGPQFEKVMPHTANLSRLSRQIGRRQCRKILGSRCLTDFSFLLSRLLLAPEESQSLMRRTKSKSAGTDRKACSTPRVSRRPGRELMETSATLLSCFATVNHQVTLSGGRFL